MKSMRINATEKVIEVEYKNVQKASDIYYKMDKWEQDRCCLNGTDLTYDLTDVKFSNIVLIVRDLFKKSCDVARFETTLVDYGARITEIFEAIIENGKLFRITVFKENGAIGKIGFGCWQYGRILNINDYEDTFVLRIRNSNLGEEVHELEFNENTNVLIEIGEIQF